uniref:Anac071 (Arabidopsis NAC domain containing protein 71) n=1 Tax=Arundo donax TaxID=35708 RepID=A0A0A9DWV5_ARUDO
MSAAKQIFEADEQIYLGQSSQVQIWECWYLLKIWKIQK